MFLLLGEILLYIWSKEFLTIPIIVKSLVTYFYKHNDTFYSKKG